MVAGDAPQGAADSLPLIFAGGQTATSNPEPYAPFFDFIALGDGEELLPEIGLVLEEGKAAGLSRSALLKDLAEVPGVYVPALGTRRVVRRVATACSLGGTRRHLMPRSWPRPPSGIWWLNTLRVGATSFWF